MSTEAIKSKAWYIKFPCDAYALGPIRFTEPATEKDARQYARRWAGVKRLVKGFQCWPTND
jgi:hypothetical protein